jgi:hypothetical protein
VAHWVLDAFTAAQVPGDIRALSVFAVEPFTLTSWPDDRQNDHLPLVQDVRTCSHDSNQGAVADVEVNRNNL